MCQLRRRQFFGDENKRLIILGKRNVRRAQQMLNQAVADVFNIDGALFHVFVVEQIEHVGELIDRLFHRNLRRFILPLDNAAYFIHEGGVVEDGEMGIKYTRFFATDHPRYFFLHAAYFVFGCSDTCMEPFKFGRQIAHVDIFLGQVPVPCRKDKRFADGDARRCRNTFNHLPSPHLLVSPP